MSYREQILARFTGAADSAPLYMPDLTLWYEYHEKNGTLPPQWRDASLPEIARAMSVPIWRYSLTERVLSSAVRVTTTEMDGERVITSQTAAGTLTARWIVGPDGAMWQTEYPVKSATDLGAVLELAKARSYAVSPKHDTLVADVGEDGLVAIEVPRRPLSDLLHEYLGWDEGLMLLFEAGDQIEEIVGVLESKLQEFVVSLSGVSNEVAYSLDNLDGQFISPRLYQDHMAASYKQTADELHKQGKLFMVHIGGPIRHLARPLAHAGVDALEGIAGPPQSDLSPADARALIGPACTVWGGISQDYLLATRDQSDFEAAVQDAVRMAEEDPGIIVGIADRVPVDADLERIMAVPKMIERFSSGG